MRPAVADEAPKGPRVGSASEREAAHGGPGQGATPNRVHPCSDTGYWRGERPP